MAGNRGTAQTGRPLHLVRVADPMGSSYAAWHMIRQAFGLRVPVEHGEGVFGTSTPRAVLFSALTTVGSFGSLMLSSHRGTASMGELLSIAIAFTLLCTLFVLPAAFRLGEKRAAKK